MSFWKTFGFHSVSAIDALLDAGEFSLEQLLDEEEILQETKSQNKKLLDFLVEPETLKKLVYYITVPADDDADAKRRFKYPFLACEVLASEVWAICDAMYQHEGLLDQLYGYFEKEPPLDPILSTYTSRVASVLLQKKVPETIAFMKTRQNIVADFLKHLGNASVIELLLKVIACEDTTDGSGTLDWLCTTELIPSLIDKFDPKQGPAVHENAAQALADIIAVSTNSASSPLIAQLESEAILNKLFSYILAEGLSSSLEHGLSVLIELLRRHMNDGLDDLTKLEDLPYILKSIVTRLESLHALITDDLDTKEADSAKVLLPRPIGAVKPLGFQKLKVVEFFSALTHTNFLFLDLELMRLNIFASCVRLFFAHPWNNFLHSIVEQMIQVVLDCESEQLKLALLKDCKLVDYVCQGSKLSEEESTKPKGIRRGYMGHITAITQSLVNAASNTPSVETFLNDHEEWNKYLKGPFQVTRDRESNTLLYAPSAEEFTNEDEEVMEAEYDNGEEFTTGEQDFRLEDDDDDEEGVIVQGHLEDGNDVWEEREIQDEFVEGNTEEDDRKSDDAK
eukprot:TRINITY_DN594_c0_g1_i1.p1 TRINITY_DN594_c0_g1~~TRINITY_DN594_c0_g1_i1.p1  ORF type:complete len:566 (-),score=171.55 TRINITY_DN594_c0_g1_i1:86-1783(-)